MGIPAKVQWNTRTWHFTRHDPDGGVYGLVDGVVDYQEFADFWTGDGNTRTCRAASASQPAAGKPVSAEVRRVVATSR